MAIANSHGLPVAVSSYEASCHEIKLVEKTLSKRFVRTSPGIVISDKAYSRDKLDKQMKLQKIKMIALNKKNKKSIPNQDGRKFRRYKRRWGVERIFVWIQNFRRCNTRYEFYQVNF